MRVKCNNCGESYDLPDVKREHLVHASEIAEALATAHQSPATRALVAVLLLRRVAATLGLGPVMVAGIADAYAGIVQRVLDTQRRHPMLRVVN